MMVPKIGPRGTTIQDVMGVAQNGAQPVQPNYVYAPPSTQPPATTAFDYASLLAGQPAATYGQKYGGMPTAEYFKSLVIGGAQQARSVGELAAMQALQANADLTSYYEPLIGKQYNTNTQLLNQPLLDPSKYTTGDSDPTGEQTARNKQDAYGAYMDRMNLLDFTPNEEGGYEPVIRGAAKKFRPEMTRDYNTQVQPYTDLANNILSVPLSEYARKIAVQQYGYDPGLAQGLFDQGVDIQALQDQQTLYGLQNPDQSYSPEERIYQLYGQEGLDQYNQQQAQSSLYGTPTEQTALEQQQYAEVDTNLFGVYASTPAEVLPENPDIARAYMTGESFLTDFQSGVAAISSAPLGLQRTTANEFLLGYANEISDPIAIRIMENLIDSTVSFMGG